MKRFQKVGESLTLALLVFLPACVTSHYDRTENFTFSWKIGDFEQAAKEAENLAERGPKRDRMLYRMEEGATKRLRRDHQGSVRAFQEVSAHYDKWFGVHLRSKTKISEELISSIGTPEWKPYKSRVYERVMLRLYQALNFMELGKQGRARAEIFKTRQAVQDAKELWNAELTASRELMSKRGIDLEKGFNRAEADQLKEETDRLKAMIPSDLGDYVNPAAIYLEALYFLHGGTQRDDYEKAFFSLRQLYALYPENPWIREDYEQARKGTSSEEDLTYVFFETGRAPVRREKRFDLPLIFLSETSRLPYAGLALPTLVTNDNFLETLEVRGQNESSWSRTVPLADMDGIVAKEFAKDYPIELTKAITGSLAKGGLQYLATDAVRSEKEPVRAVTGVAVGAFSQSITRADWRSWSTLPKQIQFCKIKTPASRELTLRGVRTNLVKKVSLGPEKTKLLWIRSISAHTPLILVNSFSMDPQSP